MSTNRFRRIDRRTAEQLLRGAPVDGQAGDPATALGDLLADRPGQRPEHPVATTPSHPAADPAAPPSGDDHPTGPPSGVPGNGNDHPTGPPEDVPGK